MTYHPIKRILPFTILCLLILVLYLSNLHTQIHLDWIREKEQALLAFTKQHTVLAPLLFIGIYTISVSLLIPDSSILTLLSGLLFPLPLALFYSVLSETLGSTVFFAACRGIFQTRFFRRERPLLSRVRREFRNHSASYLLFLRISHLLPYWTINLGAAYFKAPYRVFIWTTALGVIPLTFVLADAGASLQQLFATGQPLDLANIFTTETKVALILIGLVALFPIAYDKWKKHRRWK